MAMTTHIDGTIQSRKARSLAAFFRDLKGHDHTVRDVASLRNADDRMLDDLGLTRGQVARVLRTPRRDEISIARNSFKPI